MTQSVLRVLLAMMACILSLAKQPKKLLFVVNVRPNLRPRLANLKKALQSQPQAKNEETSNPAE